ncbi:MAG TPA: hypothetical protein VD905_11700 [Flavobacteriales bacterium]|nr:hypothetical protein [Flavobacteriales bacterium]
MTSTQNNYIIAASFAVALALSLVFARFFSPPPRRSLVVLSFFIIAFLAMWAMQLWLFPFGPVLFNVSWLQLLIAAAVFSVLVVVISPKGRNVKKSEQEEENPLIIFGIVFWLLAAVLVTSIFMGYNRNPHVKPIGNNIRLSLNEIPE